MLGKNVFAASLAACFPSCARFNLIIIIIMITVIDVLLQTTIACEWRLAIQITVCLWAHFRSRWSVGTHRGIVKEKRAHANAMHSDDCHVYILTNRRQFVSSKLLMHACNDRDVCNPVPFAESQIDSLINERNSFGAVVEEEMVRFVRTSNYTIWNA